MRGFFRWWSLEGRGSRREFAWIFFPALIALIVFLWMTEVFWPIEERSNTLSIMAVVYMIALMCIGGGAMVRRLHDLDQDAAWLQLCGLLGAFGGYVYEWLPWAWLQMAFIALSIAAASVLIGALAWRKGVEGDNRFGPDPLTGGGSVRHQGLHD